MKRALVAAIAAAITTAAVLSASGFGATTPRKAKSKTRTHHRAVHRSQALGATGASGSTGARGEPTGPPPTMAQALADMKARRDAQDKKLADALGVSVDKLHAAFDAVQAKALVAAVKANRLTQAEADAITACKKAPLTCDRSNLPAYGGRGFGHGGFDHGGFDGPGDGQGASTFLSDLATELGVTTDKLQAALQANRPQGPGFDGRHGGDGPDGDARPGAPDQQGGSYSAPPAAAGSGA